MKTVRSAKGLMVDFEMLKMQQGDTAMVVTDNTQTAPLERRSRKLTEAGKILAKKKALEAVTQSPTQEDAE